MALLRRDDGTHPPVRLEVVSPASLCDSRGGRRRSLIRAFERGTGVVTIAAGENQVGGREHWVSG